MKYAFEGMELDLAVFELRRDGVPIPMEPQVFMFSAIWSSTGIMWSPRKS